MSVVHGAEFGRRGGAMRLGKHIALGILSLVFAADAAADSTVDFRNDLVPVLTKLGCNAAACHGAAVGRGGLKLSLYGGDPAADYDAIVREVRGRRINLAKPEASLILLKPSGGLEHGGDWIFDLQSEPARLLLAWIRDGARERSSSYFARLEVLPASDVTSLDTPIPVRATAYFTDGHSRDVTAWTSFTAEDTSAVHVSDAAAELTVRRRGRHIVLARYSTAVVPLELVVPLTDIGPDLNADARENFIDREVLDTLQTLGLTPSPDVGDSGFLRRITLDLTGRLPTPQQVEAFANQDGDKRRILVDRLLRSEEFNAYWTRELAGWLRIPSQSSDVEATETYRAWLASEVRADVNFRSLARSLILATGDTQEVGPANFYRTTAGPREQAEFFSELFMGSRLRCANCHNHPLDRWTQDDYHGLAAIFAAVQSDEIVAYRPEGVVIHPATLEPATPRIPGEPNSDVSGDPREPLANWLTAAENPYFAKAIVNRLWARLMGRGLVDPVDDLRDTNPATHPSLLTLLAEDFTANGSSLRHTLRTIANSECYSRSADALDANKDDDRFYSHALRRPLPPEVVDDAISAVLGLPADPDEGQVAAGSGLSQKLRLFNGAILNSRIAADGSRLRRLRDEGCEPIEIIDEFYVAAVGRHPSADEKTYWKQQIAAAKDPEPLLEDFVWGLLAGQEFTSNH